VSTPVCSTTWRTASKIRRGRSEARSRLRQYTSTVGWNPSSSNRSPQATSRRNAVIASRSDKPLQRLQHHHRGDHLGGHRGVPAALTGNISDSSDGNSCWRWSARKAYTDHLGIR
jgi:hypothetical protein